MHLEIVDSSGEVVRRFISEEPKEEGPEKTEADGEPREPQKPAMQRAEEARIGKFKVKPGMNRVAWNGRYDPAIGVPGLYVFGTLRGRKAVPARYEVRLRVGDQTLSETFELRADPRFDASQSDYEAQDALLREVEAELTAVHTAVIEIGDVRSQLERFVARRSDEQAGDGSASGDALSERATALIEELTEIEGELVQKRTVDGQTVINFPTKLNHHLIYLRSAIDQAEGIVNEGARERLEDLKTQWAPLRQRLEALFDERLPELNRAIVESQVPTIEVPADR